jgi:hypothetical protein
VATSSQTAAHLTFAKEIAAHLGISQRLSRAIGLGEILIVVGLIVA